MVGHDGADRVALAVVRLLAEQDEVGRLLLQHLAPARSRWRATSEPASASSVRWTERSAPSETALWSARTALSGPIVTATTSSTCDRAALLDLHGRLDGVRVEGVEVLLAAAVEAPRRGSMRFSTAASGTSFTRTQIFKAGLL